MDITEAMIFKHLHWSDIIDAVQKEGSNYDTFQCKTISNRKYGKLPTKLPEEIPWNKIHVDIIGPYVIRCKGKQ